jgi:anti-sigma regulatory factor (Ser/Thr protein kinase)
VTVDTGRVEPDLAGARHEAVFYDSPDDLAARLADRLAPALHAGEPVVAALDDDHRSALVGALGQGDGIEFVDPARVHAVPAFTVAVRWARLGRHAPTPGTRTTVIGQQLDDLPGCGPEHWARLDIALNVAIAGLPITVLCPYPTCGPDVTRVRATHPVLVTAAGTGPSASYRRPHEAVVEYPPPPPPDLGTPTDELVFAGPADLPRLRRAVGAVAADAGLDAERVADVVLAVNEIATNTAEHGPGEGRVRLWISEPALVAEIADRGRMDVPFPGMSAPPPSGVRGRGLWLASELSDVLQVWSDESGTVVRVHADR